MKWLLVPEMRACSSIYLFIYLFTNLFNDLLCGFLVYGVTKTEVALTGVSLSFELFCPLCPPPPRSVTDDVLQSLPERIGTMAVFRHGYWLHFMKYLLGVTLFCYKTYSIFFPQGNL